MKLAITDANIFIDLIYLGLLEDLFFLEIELYTTYEVIEELNNRQQQVVRQYQSFGKLTVLVTEEAGTFDLPIEVESIKRLSLADLSVFHHARQLNIGILTGDNLLRKISKKHGFEVHGIIWLLEQMVFRQRLLPVEASYNLENLLQYNKRLPRKECETRIKKWKGTI